MRINSISHKIVLTIVIPVIGVLMTLGIINYWDTKGILNQLVSAEQNFTKNEISSFVELQFVALDIIEEPIQQQMEAYSNEIIANFMANNINPETINLKALRLNIGMNAETFDLYIINKQGIVVNTTYENDLGINFFNFGEIHKQYLLGLFEHGNFDSPKFFFENTTKKYKKYSYQATPDKQYIVEIGLYSKQADRIFNYMINHLNEIAEQRDNLQAVDLFFWLDAPTSLDAKKTFFPEHLSILPKLEKEKSISILNDEKSTNQTNYSYLYVENNNSKLIKGAIVRMANDAQHQLIFEKKERLKFAGVLLVMLVLIAFIAFLIKPIGKVIKTITDIAKELAIGNLSVSIDPKLKKRNDELGDLSIAIDTLIAGLVQTAEFARQTGKGNFDKEYKLLSNKDALGTTLMKMQERLTRAKRKEDIASAEEKQNKFIIDGLAQFSEILRSNNNNISLLCENILKNLVDYLELPIGAIFVAETINNETVFEAKATIAYKRKKGLQQSIKIGEGLVGRCAYEKLPIYLNEIPNDYVQLTTGLGNANPNFIILIPLLSEDKIYGVLELASFYKMDAYKISFVEKLAESIASTLASVQINQQTILLLEQSRIQSEELAANEEEMRQNMEELQATQEESAKREDNLNNELNAIYSSVFNTTYNTHGFITAVNNKYANFLNVHPDLLIDKNYTDELEILGINQQKQSISWEKLKQGIPQNTLLKGSIKGEKFNLQEFYWPINENGSSNPTKVIKISYRY